MPSSPFVQGMSPSKSRVHGTVPSRKWTFFSAMSFCKGKTVFPT